MSPQRAHWAYVEWSPNGEGEHEVTVETEHSHKKCAEKHGEMDVIVECDVKLPDFIRHVVFADSEKSAMSAARCFALSDIPFGTTYSIHYIGQCVR
jgi:hypothetical protein